MSTTLSSRVGSLNPAWNQEQTPEIMNEKFKDAMTLTCSEFVSHAQSLASSWWPARSIVQVPGNQIHCTLLCCTVLCRGVCGVVY